MSRKRSLMIVISYLIAGLGLGHGLVLLLVAGSSGMPLALAAWLIAALLLAGNYRQLSRRPAGG